MQPEANRKLRILLAAAIVLVALGVANYVGWLRLKPEVSAIAWIADKPDYESHLVNIHQRALARTQPGATDAYLPIYDIQNPGLFLLVAELFVRAGATTPVPLEILSIVLFNIGALCFFFWVYLLFTDLLVAAFATAFLALSQFFLFFPGITHTMPFEFVFFNATLLLFMLYLKRNATVWLGAALLAMFLTCMNYWFYYMSTWIIMMGLWWQHRGRPGIRVIAMISAPPVAAAAATMAMVMLLSGGIERGGLRLLQILVARTFDARVPGGTWYPDQRFMNASDWLRYPSLVEYRLEWAYNFNFRWFAAAAACALFVLWFRKRNSVVSALILLAGGSSWYYVMFQHTHIHHFTGQYSFMAICPIAGLIAGEMIVSAIAIVRLLRRRLASGHRVVALPLQLPIRSVAAVALILVGSRMLFLYLKTTVVLITQAVTLSHSVEAKYQQAVNELCRGRSAITQADLELASKAWGTEWRAKQLADTNQMPTCSGSSSGLVRPRTSLT